MPFIFAFLPVTERVLQYENLTETRPSKLGISREKKETQQNIDRILNLYHYFGLGIFKISFEL